MKTGVEIIAETRKNIPDKCDLSQARGFLDVTMNPFASENNIAKALAYAGAIIAVEIDRLNNVKQG